MCASDNIETAVGAKHGTSWTYIRSISKGESAMERFKEYIVTGVKKKKKKKKG
jgi:hypothetical protein